MCNNAEKGKVSSQMAQWLLEEARRINTPEFIGSDPVQFPRRFQNIQDIEIVSLTASIMAWGRREMICRDIERLLEMMDNNPSAFVREQEYERVPDRQNIHRTMFGAHLKWLLRGLHHIYSRYPSIDAMLAEKRVGETEAPAWEMAQLLQQAMCTANPQTPECRECIPTQLDKTALKRLNMALRWLVRDDGIVDMGVWKSIRPEKLYIPLDVHVGNISRELGLLERRSNDRKAVEQLTARMREINPTDPCLLDFALFGIGIEGKGNG